MKDEAHNGSPSDADVSSDGGVAWALTLAHELGAIAETGRRLRPFIDRVRDGFAGDAAAATRYRPLTNGGVEIFDRHELSWDELAELTRARASLHRPHAGEAPAGRGSPGDAISETLEQTDGTWIRVDLYRAPGRPPFAESDARWLALLVSTIFAIERRPRHARAAAVASRLAAFSPRERETLDHLLAGASEKEVARRLNRSRHTVHAYVKRIYRRLNVNSRPELLAMFVVQSDGHGPA